MAAVDPGRPDQDARLLLQPAEAPHVRVPADRRRSPTGELYEYECLFRPHMPMLPQSISSVVQAAINTDRGVELDVYIVATALERIGRLEADGRERRHAEPRRYAINLTPVQPARSAPSRRPRWPPRSARPASTRARSPSSAPSSSRSPTSARSSARSRPCARLGFGFAVDDAGAGYASFALIAALRPSIIKIDREIVHGIGHDDAKQALVEAFVSFGRRIGAHLLAEGIERRADLAALTALGVELGQGYLLGRPAFTPMEPRRLDRVGRAAEAKRKTRASVARRRGRAPTRPTPDPAALAYHRGHDRALPRVPFPRPHPRLPRRRTLRDDLHGRPRRRPAPGGHLVHARRRRDRHQQPHRATLADQPAARSADRVLGRRRGRWRALGRASRAWSARSTPTARRARPTSPAMARRYHGRDPDEVERTIAETFERRTGSASGSAPIAIHDHLDDE